jgi:hypothetical protein
VVPPCPSALQVRRVEGCSARYSAQLWSEECKCSVHTTMQTLTCRMQSCSYCTCSTRSLLRSLRPLRAQNSSSDRACRHCYCGYYYFCDSNPRTPGISVCALILVRSSQQAHEDKPVIQIRSPPAEKNDNKCFQCGTTFGIFTLKHNCRNCGNTVCDAHSRVR